MTTIGNHPELTSSLSDRVNFQDAVHVIAYEWFHALPDDYDLIKNLDPHEAATSTTCKLETDDDEMANDYWITQFTRTNVELEFILAAGILK